MLIQPNALVNRDCLDVLPHIPDGSVDMILADLPYGVTQNKWDSVIDLPTLWKHYHRIAKPNAAIVLFGQDKFSARLMLSNEKYHRYNLIWKKADRTSGFLNANRQPLRNHEDIMVFYRKQPTYNPQMWEGKPSHDTGEKYVNSDHQKNHNYNKVNRQPIVYPKSGSMQKFPRSILDFDRPHPPIHPTQKPVALSEWLIRTFTSEAEVVLDNCMGSGTTCIAAQNTGRRYIGIEIDADYFKLATDRVIAAHWPDETLLPAVI